MKQLTTLILSVIVLTTCGQSESSFTEKKVAIDKEEVNQISISGYCAPLDTCDKSTYRLYHLNDVMKEELINKLNKFASKDPSNFNVYLSEYQLYIDLEDGTTRNFKIIGKTIMEGNIGCFEIDDVEYFENLWTILDNEWERVNNE